MLKAAAGPLNKLGSTLKTMPILLNKLGSTLKTMPILLNKLGSTLKTMPILLNKLGFALKAAAAPLKPSVKKRLRSRKLHLFAANSLAISPDFLYNRKKSWQDKLER